MVADQSINGRHQVAGLYVYIQDDARSDSRTTMYVVAFRRGSSLCTISTSDSDEMLRTYIVTPTSTAGPVL